MNIGMKKKKESSEQLNIVIFLLLVIAALVCRWLGKMSAGRIFFGTLRTVIYIGLYIGWAISIHKRVIQKSVRNTLLLVAGLMVFWFVVRTTKYFFTYDLQISRYLWYCYYIPMLFIPLTALQAAFLLGQPEEYRLPGWLKGLCIPTGILSIFVLTNDLHQLVFAFPEGAAWSDSSYTYGWGYYAVILWEIVCALIGFLLMLYKCRHSRKKKYLPLIGISATVLYAAIYVSGVEWMKKIGGDITAVLCLFFVGILESCVRCGLIQTNTGYERLFEVCALGAQITDQDYNVCYTSSNAMPLSKKIMKEAMEKEVVINKKTLIQNRDILGGHVLWQEDIEDIIQLLERLEENRKTIEESNCIEQENYQTKAAINMLREKNRLFDKLQTQTAKQIDLLNDLLRHYDEEENQEKSRRLLAKISLVGTYIKRRGNLEFIEERSKISDAAELEACIEESFSSLRLMDIDCACSFPTGEEIYVSDAVSMYQFFETVVEKCVDTCDSLWIKLRSQGEKLLFCMEIESKMDLTIFSKMVQSCTCEDGIWCFTFAVEKAGEP